MLKNYKTPFLPYKKTCIVFILNDLLDKCSKLVRNFFYHKNNMYCFYTEKYSFWVFCFKIICKF